MYYLASDRRADAQRDEAATPRRRIDCAPTDGRQAESPPPATRGRGIPDPEQWAGRSGHAD